MGDFDNELPNIFDEVAIWDHFQDLCAKLGVECKEHHTCAQEAMQTGDWVVAYLEWHSCKDVIVRSGSLLDRDSWLWFLGFHALVSANLCAFYSRKIELALTAAVAAFKARVEVQNVPEAVDFKSYVLPTLCNLMFLWASTSDCEEEALDPEVKAFLIDALGHPRNSVSDSEVRTLKEQCKEFVINQFQFVVWDIQAQYLYYSNMEECLRWAREGSKLYKERYPGKLDYISRFIEALILMTSMSWKDAAKVLAEISSHLDSEPRKGKDWCGHPAALPCDPERADLANNLLCTCYEQMLQSGVTSVHLLRNRQDRERWNELAKQVKDWRSSLQQSLSERKLVEIRSSTVGNPAQVWEHTVNNKWFDEATACYQKCKTKYRQSYESGFPDESSFSNAKSWATKFLESNLPQTVYPQAHPLILHGPELFMRLVELYHEKDRQVMFLRQSSNIRPSVNLNEIVPIFQYGKKVIEWLVKAFIQHTKQIEYWILYQDLYKRLYYMLQFHSFAVWIGSRGCTLDRRCNMTFEDRLEQLWNQSLMPGGVIVEPAVSQEIWKQSLLWAERQRAKSTHFQLAPKMLSTSALKQLGEFDLEDDLAWNTLKSSRAACGPGTVVLEYFFSEKNSLQFVYVMTREDEVYMQILMTEDGDFLLLGQILESLRMVFSQWSNKPEEVKRRMNEYLEDIYWLLIGPVANFLDDMEQEDKLIIIASEMLNDVPFAALRKPDSPIGEGYLIQSHTISVTPSLRMLEHCNQRLKKLDQNAQLISKPGTIVAVGDPTENLKKSGEEVEFIEELFGKEHVKKLVGPEATPSEVLKWAKYPSENSVKQVVFHIAAHAIGQDDARKVKKGAILLARPASSSQQNYGTERQGAMLRAEDAEPLDYDNAHMETELGDLFSMVDVKEEAQISSHGEVGGIRTGIVVRTSKHAAGMLKSENISGCGFQWEAHMVVLSGCETARGQITGEGVWNLPRALMIAGVPCVVVSQWKVGDSSTCELMKGFYGELRSGKDVSSSLRAAMLKVIKDGVKDGGNVHEWAPFFVCGLPTVCLPTELQAGTSSCEGHDRGTSSDTKAELRI